MTWQWLALAATALVALALVVALVALRARTRRELAAARAESAALRERLDRLEQEQPPPAARPSEQFTITWLGENEAPSRPPTRLEGTVFADLLLRESVIRLGSLGHGVRHALSAESRNRIRFEMRREVKRARKQRRVEQREAYREWQQRQREGHGQQDVA